ncbi:MAG: FG-GAP-like repeat-containing protein [Flavobacteriales bacterium]
MTKRIFCILFLSICAFYAAAQFDLLQPIPTQNQVPDNFGSGVSFYDFDKDGFDDITILDNEIGARAFRNDGDSTFTLWHTFPSSSILKSISWVDFDNDGDADIFFTCYNCSNAMYRNDGNGNFTIINDQFFPAMPADYNTGQSWGDYDNDGFLDLYICVYNSLPNGSTNLLYHNNGDGTFEEVAGLLGVSNGHRRSFQSIWADFNLDGWQDMYVINDKNDINGYFLNNSGVFTSAPNQYGLNLLMDAMSASVADYDDDGDFDIYITDILTGHALMRNEGPNFVNAAPELGIDIPGGWGWGALWIDSDLDGDDDLFVCNKGALSNENDNRYFTNEAGIFTDTGSDVLNGSLHSSFAPAKGDFNNDGRCDIVVTNNNPVSTVLWQNQFDSTGNYVKLGLIGTISNRDGIGSVVRCYHNAQNKIIQTRCGENYLGQNSQYEIVGLGSDTLVDSLIVVWPSGWVDKYFSLLPNTLHTLTEGETFSVELNASGTTLCPSGNENILISVEGDLEVLWSTDEFSTSIVVESAGIYSAIATNEFGLSDTASIQIIWISDPLLSVQLNAPLCFEGTDGSIELEISLPSETQVFWNGNEGSTVLSEISAGIIYCELSDQAGCVFNYSFELPEPEPISVDFFHASILCNGETIPVSVELDGGVGPYTIDWGSIDSTVVGAGNYTVLVSDANGCSTMSQFALDEPDSLVFISTTPSVCFGDSITPTWQIVGGIEPFFVQFPNEDSEEFVAGFYPVWITDSQDCFLEAAIEIEEYDQVQINYEVSEAFNGDNGSIELFVTGGTEPYAYAWSNGGDTNPLTDIPQGYFQCLVTDFHNCFAATENILVLDAGMQTKEKNTFRIFPNPAGDVVYFDVKPDWQNEVISISDLTGRIVYKSDLNSAKGAISIWDWQEGTYFIKIADVVLILVKL